ncbi:hypothetical protein N7528_006810 [Penicillium herquei]|nr:hypothetical protein N7528_006810 [Penicillium herquei]
MFTTAKMEVPDKDNKTIFSEFHDLARITLVNQILTAMGITKLRRGNVFVLWFSHMKQLQDLARKAESCDPTILSSVKAQWLMDRLCTLVADVPGCWCYARDRDECLVTKRSSPTLEAAHIVPFRLNQSDLGLNSAFHLYFAIWWGAEWSYKLRELLSSDSSDFSDSSDWVMNTEFLANMMTLSKQVQAYWGQAMCAFRPIEINEEKTKMRLGFHWLPLLPRSVKRNTIISATENPFDGDDRSYLLPTRKISLFNYEKDKRIVSGDVFTVETDDPQNRPLPSWDLLLLMWHLTRIAAMQGAGEDTDDDEASSDDDVDQESDYVLC